MSEPAVPYIAPWKTGFRRYSVQTFQAVAATGGGPVTPTFLGSFTQAQWPPSGGAVSQGQIAELADTYGSLTFAWLLEYRPDLDATYPWRSYGGKTASDAVLYGGGYTQGGQATPTDFGPIKLPVAGVWTLTISGAAGSVNPTCTVQLGTTLGGSDIMSTSVPGANNRSQDAKVSGNYTGTKGQNVYARYSAASSTDGYNNVANGVLAVRPVKVANA